MPAHPATNRVRREGYTPGSFVPIPSSVEADALQMTVDGTGDPGPDGASLLVVDDDPFIGRLLEIELRAAGYDVRVAGGGEQALELARERCPDLVLADVMMPNMDGFELTRQLRGDPRTAAVRVIMLTARGLSADKIEGFTVGADDYVVKPFDTPELLARIRGVLRGSKERQQLSSLTGLPGNVRVEEEVEARILGGAPFAVLYADLDGFRAYNEHYGFARGDRAIALTGELLQEVARDVGSSDIVVGHVGGDDFVVVCGTGEAERLAALVVARFDERVGDLYDPQDRDRRTIRTIDRRGRPQEHGLMSISIGVVTTERRSFAHVAEAIAIAAEMKAFTKSTPGSSWAVDRRTS
jgi:diguanylate cyclase (GGDEF)-like protein